MKATWKDYPTKSDLVLVFGHVSAEVICLSTAPIPGGNPATVEPDAQETWGIITHPFVPETLVGTRADAKLRAEAILRGILNAATEALG